MQDFDGSVQLAGPYDEDYRCTAGVPCTLLLSGLGFADSNSLVVVEGACDTPRADVEGADVLSAWGGAAVHPLAVEEGYAGYGYGYVDEAIDGAVVSLFATTDVNYDGSLSEAEFVLACEYLALHSCETSLLCFAIFAKLPKLRCFAVFAKL